MGFLVAHVWAFNNQACQCASSFSIMVSFTLQVGAKGKPADLNVGAVIVLPEGFTLAPEDRIPEKLKEEMAGLTFIQYSDDQPNMYVAGPVPGKQFEEMHLAILSPDPKTNPNVHYGTLPVYVGGNRGRGQVNSRIVGWTSFPYFRGWGGG